MTAGSAPGFLKQFRRSPWRFQQTFRTSLQTLPAFTSAILSAGKGGGSACLTVDQVVFGSEQLTGLLARNSVAASIGSGCAITATTEQEITALVNAAASDVVDFFFFPMPRTYLLYADHDEYATCYGSTKSNLNRITKPLLENGFEEVHGFVRRL